MENCFSIFKIRSLFLSTDLKYLKVFRAGLLFSLAVLNYKIFDKFNSTGLGVFLLSLNLNRRFYNIRKYDHVVLKFILSLFIAIFLRNIIGLMPYSFCLTSHLSITLSLGLGLWLWRLNKSLPHNSKSIFLHFVITGVPLLLAPILVLVETVGLFIRPVTLSVRLAANMTAGHLIIFIFRERFNFNVIDVIVFVLLLIIYFLEIFVCLIQSFVFSMLFTIYCVENA